MEESKIFFKQYQRTRNESNARLSKKTIDKKRSGWGKNKLTLKK